MPTMRATVTVEEAIPYASRATDSTAAVDRGVTVSPKPAPNSASAPAADSIDVSAVQPAISTSPTIEAPSPTSVTMRSDRSRTANPDTSAPHRGREPEGAEREALLVGTAVQDAVHEHRAAHDRRREPVAGQRRHEGGRGERQVAEQPGVEERVPDAQAAQQRQRAGDGREAGQDQRGDHRVHHAAATPPPGCPAG